jgi:3-phosphoshikimate 1-carboxyvinyltransferase
MTSKLVEAFPQRGGEFQIEPDASSASYFLASERLLPERECLEFSEQFGIDVPTKYLSSIRIKSAPHSGWQVDERFRRFLGFGKFLHLWVQLEKQGKTGDEQRMHAEFAKCLRMKETDAAISRKDDLGDSIMTAVVLTAASWEEPIRFTDLGSLRLQECERVVALRTELTKCGAKVIEEGDTLTVYPSKLHGATIETYNDHRMAMCFAILGLKVPGIKIQNPACVKKTFPNFFQKLATPPPSGLGAEIRDGHTGRRLSVEELFAE